MFTLIIEDADGAVADEYSFEEGEFIVGRSHSGDIILPSDNVSRRHARLYTQGGRCFIEDLNSSNGVFVNGQRIHRPFEIVRAAQIKVGDYYLHVEGAGYGDPDPQREVARQQGAQAAYEMSPDPGGSAAIYGRLVGTSEPVLGQPYDLVRAMTLVGRGKDCAVTVIDPSMSRVHAKVGRDHDGDLFVEDLRSSNGTYVNDTRISRQKVDHGDRVRFGNVEFILELPGMDDVDIVEVSSGGRKGLIFLIVFLVLVLIGGGVTLFLYRDAIFGGGAEVAAESEADREARKAAEEAEKRERYESAERRLDSLIEKAEKLARRDRWDDSKKVLVEGAKLLERIGRLDEKGELNARFTAAEAELREAKRDYDEFFDAFADADYVEAGVAYKRLVKRGGPLKLLAKSKLGPKRDELLASGDALCAQKLYEKCLEFYQQAKALDPTDASIGKKVAETRALEQEARKKLEEEKKKAEEAAPGDDGSAP